MNKTKTKSPQKQKERNLEGHNHKWSYIALLSSKILYGKLLFSYYKGAHLFYKFMCASQTKQLSQNDQKLSNKNCHDHEMHVM